MAKKKKRVVRKPKQPQSIVSDEIFIPNNSGMLDAGKVHRTPTDDLDPVNKKYVDDETHWDRTGTNVHTKTSTDKVGIGTDEPLFSLHVKASNPAIVSHTSDGTNAAALITNNNLGKGIDFFSHGDNRVTTRYGLNLSSYGELYCNNANGLIFGITTASPIIFATNNTEKMRLLSDGKLGVGTGAPVADLHIYAARSNTAGAGSLMLDGQHAERRWGWRIDTSNNLHFERNLVAEGGWQDVMVFTRAGRNVGIGISPTEKLDINGDAIRIRNAQTPATAGATGTTGMVCWDASYIYVCTAANTWKRVAIATW